MVWAVKVAETMGGAGVWFYFACLFGVLASVLCNDAETDAVLPYIEIAMPYYVCSHVFSGFQQANRAPAY